MVGPDPPTDMPAFPPAHQEVALVPQLLLKTCPKHCDLPVIAAFSLGDRHGQGWSFPCCSLQHGVSHIRTLGQASFPPPLLGF